MRVDRGGEGLPRQKTVGGIQPLSTEAIPTQPESIEVKIPAQVKAWLREIAVDEIVASADDRCKLTKEFSHATKTYQFALERRGRRTIRLQVCSENGAYVFYDIASVSPEGNGRNSVDKTTLLNKLNAHLNKKAITLKRESVDEGQGANKEAAVA